VLIAVEGVYREGKIELKGVPEGIAEDTPVIVTFLLAYNFDEAQATDLRARLSIEESRKLLLNQKTLS
jgi:hypothetical protein